MPRSKRLLKHAAYLLLAVLAVVSVAAGPAEPAVAGTGTITYYAVSSPNSNEGALRVVVHSSASIATMTTQLLNGSGTDVLDVPMTMNSQGPFSGGGYQSIWDATSPITEGTPPSGLPLGVYQVKLAVVFTGDSTPTLADAGTFAFTAVPRISITASPTVISYGGPKVTISGHLTQVAPDGTVSPYDPGSVSLDLSWHNPVTIQVSTQSDGSFSTVVAAPDGSPSPWTEAFTPDLRGGTVNSNEIKFTYQVDNARVTAVLNHATGTYGKPEKISGQVTYQAQAGGSYAAAPGEKVNVYSAQQPYPGTPAATGKTDASGHYALTLPDTTGTTWTVRSAGSAGDALLTSAVAKVSEAVKVPTAITKFHVSLNRYWRLSYHGCLGLKAAIPGLRVPTAPGIRLQYSAHPKGPWHTLKAKYTAKKACGKGGTWFSGAAKAPRNFAYYRVHYAGTKPAATLTAPKYLASASHAKLAWKYADRIRGLRVSPHVVNKNGRLTITGQLQYYRYHWRNFSHQVIYIIFRRKGTANWYWVVRVHTNSTGHFRARVRDWEGTAVWSALYKGNAKHLSTSPAGVHVRVR